MLLIFKMLFVCLLFIAYHCCQKDFLLQLDEEAVLLEGYI